MNELDLVNKLNTLIDEHRPKISEFLLTDKEYDKSIIERYEKRTVFFIFSIFFATKIIVTSEYIKEYMISTDKMWGVNKEVLNKISQD